MFNPIAHYRAQAYAAQHGRCFYCHVEMCNGHPAPFAQSHGISIAQAQLLECTAEHLIARKDGGRNTRENIVARRPGQSSRSRLRMAFAITAALLYLSRFERYRKIGRHGAMAEPVAL